MAGDLGLVVPSLSPSQLPHLQNGIGILLLLTFQDRYETQRRHGQKDLVLGAYLGPTLH